MFTYCVFDLDGTLLDTVHALWVSVNLTLDHFGYSPSDKSLIRKFVGDGYRMLMKRALLYSGDEKLEHYEESLKVYMDFFAQHSMDGVKPYEGIPELLKELKRRGIRITVFSNKPDAQAVSNIETVFGKGYFDFIAGEKAGVPRKPDPAGVFRIMDELGERPEQGIYFGDTNTDMRTGLAAGLTTVGVCWGFRGREELESFHPQYVIDRPAEVFEKIIT
ncbi:MAG: HAD family hydrolase [Clostridiales bacterium]|nr:HAD family hydrolase [Clostridiales bacterium]